MDQSSLVEQQKHYFLAQYTRMLENPKCTYGHVSNKEKLDNAWINNVCDVFCEPVKCITNHGTPFPGAHTGGNGEPRRGNSENSGNGGARGSNERYKGKKTKK